MKGFHRVLGAQVALQKANAECSRACAELGDAWREWFEQFAPLAVRIEQALAQEDEEPSEAGSEAAPPWLIDGEDTYVDKYINVDKKGGEA